MPASAMFADAVCKLFKTQRLETLRAPAQNDVDVVSLLDCAEVHGMYNPLCPAAQPFFDVNSRT